MVSSLRVNFNTHVCLQPAGSMVDWFQGSTRGTGSLSESEFMRRSPLQHPLAVLRTHLGLGQKEFGDKVGRHWRTIQSVELGKLPLSAKLAERICDETGVNFQWLMNGDPDAEILDERGLRWSREAFFDVQGRKLLAGSRLGRHYAVDLLTNRVAQMCAAVVAASETKNIRVYPWLLANAIDKVMEESESYADLKQEFQEVMMAQADDTEAALSAVVGYALHRCRKWKEPRIKPTPKGGRRK